ncbi:HAD-IA family hydrolase [Salinirubellus salinus]|uniref:HAD-IA family hydrolase n=1 Tax=Salinirubellus salinus TaxID=1364945 RepID=A0A9E7UCD9_9EURY|nr:HAD-IA family hydrolase [Salinirubellus salinus]UWM56147.1 HAD-IA family hydrolase [Salinirubellus salinus]
MRVLAFDMDGVLVDSERYWLELERESIFPSTVATDVDPEEVTGMNVNDLYHHLSAEYGTTVDEAAFVERYDRAAVTVYDEQVTLLEGLDGLLARLEEAPDVRVALVSSSPVRWIDRVLDRFDLRGAFDAVVSAEHVERGKPDPDVYARAASVLDADPAASLAVEDSANGLRAAAAAGYETVGYLNGTNEVAALSAADRVAEGPVDLERAVEAWLDA